MAEIYRGITVYGEYMERWGEYLVMKPMEHINRTND
jgi:hypothetical protein